VLAAPQAVAATDGRRHLVYEVQLVNVSPLNVRVDRVAVRNGVTGATIKVFVGKSIAPIMSTPLRPATRTLPAAQDGVLWLDVSFPRGAQVPARLTHRIVTTVGGRGFPKRVIAWVGAGTTVDRRAPVVISPPLRGVGYVDGNGCCGASAHTRALLTIDGSRFLAQRYAIDWVRFDSIGRWVVGDPTENENYIVFGDPIYAVAPGRVVSILATLPENTPPAPLANLNPQNALGNHIIEDLGDGRFALYAHMQPHSIPAGIRSGSRLARGQVIGRVGNTGSSSAPHLHFHITDGPDAVGSDGRPYVFSSFRYTGVVLNVDAVSDHLPRPSSALQSRPRCATSN
jgi:Peptidase family M23